MDIVICVSLKDCFIARKNLFHIHKNIKADNIFIITDKRNFWLFSKRIQHKYNVTLIDEEDIITNRQQLEAVAQQHFTCDYRFGWYYQQFLKIGFAKSQYAKKFYLIWDSDTIPLKELSFIDKERMIFTPKTEYHKAYFETMQALIGYGKEAEYSFIAEHMAVSVPIMQELIQKIQDSDIQGSSWPAKIINATPTNDSNGFSEFETYGTYCHHNYPDKFVIRELQTFREGGSIYSRGISKRTLCKLSEKYDTISLENWSIPDKYRYRLRNNIEEYAVNTINTLRKHYPFIHI